MADDEKVGDGLVDVAQVQPHDLPGLFFLEALNDELRQALGFVHVVHAGGRGSGAGGGGGGAQGLGQKPGGLNVLAVLCKCNTGRP